MKYNIQGGLIATPELILQNAALVIENNFIKQIGKPDPSADFNINLDKDDIILPALINAHDHLLGSYYPKVGNGPYMNWLSWDNDLKSHELYFERSKISNEDLYLLGSYKNLISGAVTVSDHIPHSVNEKMIDKMPVRIIKDYSLEHECSSYDLKWGRGITIEHKEAKEKNIPFITHLEEGFDEEATLGVDILKELKVLDENTVLIHGISFSDSDIDEIAAGNVNVVWCPSSNYYMFKETVNIKRLLKKNVNVSLGTDSPMSGGLNILEELRFARDLYYKMYNEILDDKILIRMVTVNPARSLRMSRQGKIEPGYSSDILVLSGGDPKNPYKTLINSWFNEIKLVTRNGTPIYGSEEFTDIFKRFKYNYQTVNINGVKKILIGKPLDLCKRIWENVGFKKELPFFPVEF